MGCSWFSYLTKGYINDDACFFDMFMGFINFFAAMLIGGVYFESGRIFGMIFVGVICGTIVIASICAVICKGYNVKKYKLERDYDLLEHQSSNEVAIRKIEAECYKKSLEKEKEEE